MYNIVDVSKNGHCYASGSGHAAGKQDSPVAPTRDGAVDDDSGSVRGGHRQVTSVRHRLKHTTAYVIS